MSGRLSRLTESSLALQIARRVGAAIRRIDDRLVVGLRAQWLLDDSRLGGSLVLTESTLYRALKVLVNGASVASGGARTRSVFSAMLGGDADTRIRTIGVATLSAVVTHV